MASQKAIAALTTAGGAVALAANTARIKSEVVVENSDANRCYLLIGSGTVSATNYSFSLAQYDKARLDNQTDQVQVIWGTAAGGALLVTEWVN